MMITTKKKIIVDISDAKISRNPDDVLITYSLGSCIGVSFYCPDNSYAALLHYQLPESKIDPEKAKKIPFMFADTGIDMIVKKFVSLGCNKKKIIVKIAGGSQMQTGPKGFDIGKRNHLAIRKILWKQGMLIDSEDIGGDYPRNLSIEVETGTVISKGNNVEKQL